MVVISQGNTPLLVSEISRAHDSSTTASNMVSALWTSSKVCLLKVSGVGAFKILAKFLGGDWDHFAASNMQLVSNQEPCSDSVGVLNMNPVDLSRILLVYDGASGSLSIELHR